MQNWHEEMHSLRSVGTAKKLPKIYIQYNAPLNERSFPVMRTDDKSNSALSKALLAQHVRTTETESTSKAKSNCVVLVGKRAGLFLYKVFVL